MALNLNDMRMPGLTKSCSLTWLLFATCLGCAPQSKQEKQGHNVLQEANDSVTVERDFSALRAVDDSGKPKYEVKHTAAGKICSFDGSFTLPIPNDEDFEEIKQSFGEWDGLMGAYLSYYFAPTGEKQALDSKGEDICHYSVEFAKKIQYESKTCNAGAGFSIISLPKISNAFAKKLLYAVVRPWDENDPYRWSSDTLFYTEDGMPASAGGNVEIEQAHGSTIVKLYCTD